MAFTMPPTIKLSKSDVMVDEKVRIVVNGLQGNQKISLLATLKENKKIFAACGQYAADDHGQVDTFLHSSLGGSYKGIQQMGLFTSTKEVYGSTRLIKLNAATPYMYDVTISVHDGHRDFESFATDDLDSRAGPLAATTLRRWYMAPGVNRIPVRDRRLRGAVFIPAGKGPFPGIVDVFGMAGGLLDFRASLLASHGFLTFSLAYIEDLTRDPRDINIEYFLEAVDWLNRHPMASSGNIGMVGHSLGGSICLSASTISPLVKVVVNVNGNPFLLVPRQHDFGEGTVVGANMDVSKGTFVDECFIQKDAFKEYNIEDHLIPMWKDNLKGLMVAGEDDLCVDAKWFRVLQDAIPAEKKDNFRFLYYPGAGHLIEPPYSPHCVKSYNKILGVNNLWGGKPIEHVAAQELAWREILSFLQKHLMNKSHL